MLKARFSFPKNGDEGWAFFCFSAFRFIPVFWSSVKLDARHHHAIQLLIDHRFTGKKKQELAVELGIRDRTLRKWIADPTFAAAYEAALARWLADLEGIRFRHRKERVKELQRLYDATPDSYLDKVIHAKGRVYDAETETWIEVDAQIIDTGGEVLVDGDGKPVSVVAVRKMNVDAKSGLLEQIAEEVGDRVTRHELTGANGSDLFSAMKEAAESAISILSGGSVPGAAPGGAPASAE